MAEKKWAIGDPADKSKPLLWLAVAAILLIKWFIVPAVPVQPVAEFVTRYIPTSLAPANWVLGLALYALCAGPLLMPKNISIFLKVLFGASVLVFFGSWRSHPSISPVIGGIWYLEDIFLIPAWESKRMERSAAPLAQRSNPDQID
jgi:hypothetical protein